MARFVLALLLLVAACSTQKNNRPAPVIGQAFVGPINLNLRLELSPASKPVATVHHGDRLDILQVRRRFVRVRTPGGQEGWTDSRQLLSTEQMEELAALAKSAARLPSQGEAKVYDPLNVHTEPSRPSTSFYQITDKMRVDVVGHKLAPRSNEPPKSKLQIAKPALRVRTKAKKEPKIPPPPPPPTPRLPRNWLELSRTNLPQTEEAEESKPKIPLENWSLIRTKDGKAGWVLTRNLVMAIPDEVAQYSEGARITSYFALGDVADGEQVKHHWLWTTIREGTQPYQFDSFRVFIYMLRRHRYETAYIERNVEGYYPAEVTRGAAPKFSLLIRDRQDGDLHRKTYVLEGYMVRKIADEIVKPQKGGETGKTVTGLPGADADDNEDEEELPKPSLMDRFKALFRRR